jgi:hypothetical protein
MTARRGRTTWIALAFAALLAPRAAADEWDDAKKEFRKAQKAEEAKTRAGAYTDLAFHDRAEAVEEIIGAITKEQNAAVVLAGIKALSRLEAEGSKAALASAIRSKTGTLRLHLIVAATEQRVPGGHEVLLEVLQGKDAQAAALAALALGKRGVREALPHFKTMLASDDWHLRSAAARAISAQAGDAKDLVPALADALAVAEGRDRADLAAALEKITGRKYGIDAAAWKLLAAGTKPEEITAKTVPLPYCVGLPIHGRRVVILMDNGVRTDDPHPFTNRERLQALCQVPGARPVPWYEIRTVRQFMTAHATRVVSDLPTQGVAFDVISIGLKARPAFGKLTPANEGNQKAAKDFLEGLRGETQHGPRRGRLHHEPGPLARGGHRPRRGRRVRGTQGPPEAGADPHRGRRRAPHGAAPDDRGPLRRDVPRPLPLTQRGG